jgi:hypothetical protein
MPSVIEYTARRSFFSDHTAGEKYEIEVEIALDSAQQEIEEVKFIERSPGGAMEQGLERIDTFIPLTIINSHGAHLMQLREFLDSTESGETFKVWVCDESDSPRGVPYVLKRLDEGHTEMAFIRKGSRMDDAFQVTIRGVVSGSVVDGEVVDSDGSDIYDPNSDPDGTGTGGLQPPGLAPSTDPTVVMGSSGFTTIYSSDADFVGPSGNIYAYAAGSLVSGMPVNALGLQVVRDKQNFAFPFMIQIRAPTTPSAETFWFSQVVVKDSGGTPLTDGTYNVGSHPGGGGYEFNDTDIGGGIHEYAWRWHYFSPSAGVDLVSGNTYKIEMI